jgi:hypothetical protein
LSEGSSVIKAGNVWLVKSTYQVKVRNPVAPAPQFPTPAVQQTINNPRNGPTPFVMRPPIIPPVASVSSSPPKTIKPINQTSTTLPAVDETSIPVVDEPAFPASQLLTQFTATTTKKQKAAPFVQPSQVPQMVQVTQAPQNAKVLQVGQTIKLPQTVQPTKTTQSVQAAQATQVSQVSQPIQGLKRVSSNQTVPMQKPNQQSEIPPAPAVAIPTSQLMTILAVPSNSTPPTKNIPSAPPVPPPEDSKMLSKTIPSLCVVVRPANALPDVVNSKKREALGWFILSRWDLSSSEKMFYSNCHFFFFFLDSFVKSRLVLDARRFAEWLMQVGLLRSQQFGVCRTHNTGTQSPCNLQLRMYTEETKFPHRLVKN